MTSSPTLLFLNVKFFFNQRTLKVGTKRMPPFVSSPSADADESEFSGLCIDLLRELASSLNFTYELKLPVLHEGWGIEDDNRTWNGLVGLLHKREVDLVVAPLSFTPDKSLVMETTVPYYHNNLAAVFKKRDPLLDKWRIYMRPFRGEVFLCLGVALIVETFLMHMLAWYDPTVYASKGNKHQHRIFPGPSPDDGFWHMFGVLLSQGGSTLPESCSGRILQAAWILFSIVIGATYSGNLIAFLTVELEQMPFQTLGELLNQDVYKWGTFGNAAVYTLLTESKNPVYRALGEHLLVFARSDPGVISLNISEQQRKVRGGNFALLVESSMAEAWTRDNCDLSSVVDTDVSFPYGVYLPKGSDYTELLNDFILKIWEANLASKWMENSMADSNICVKDVVSDNPHIAVADVQSVLYVSIVGMVLALIALATEWLVFKNPRLREWVTKAANAFVDGFQRRHVSDNEDASVTEDADLKSSSDFPWRSDDAVRPWSAPVASTANLRRRLWGRRSHSRGSGITRKW
ncbi:glutamate receptor U1-like [Pomacea canaliculata]|uniref:glutamate receptor U1-like n=1 Tax=Pomacea canaliculata TaxID=400727 RepID=UPI000D73C030|nr:glutamate receptor U1-like [Pomacea canaliculata]